MVSLALVFALALSSIPFARAKNRQRHTRASGRKPKEKQGGTFSKSVKVSEP
jgi:hypothetical protein